MKVQMRIGDKTFKLSKAEQKIIDVKYERDSYITKHMGLSLPLSYDIFLSNLNNPWDWFGHVYMWVKSNKPDIFLSFKEILLQDSDLSLIDTDNFLDFVFESLL